MPQQTPGPDAALDLAAPLPTEGAAALDDRTEGLPVFGPAE
ncbi:MAG TPA: hypothetical protein VGR91_18215 [Stellaceae bacterium]|nr:hypothetical protein [Stellaceae bacterium]